VSTFLPDLNGAVLSPCRTWRYRLERNGLGANDRRLLVIGLNPSTADETLDDPTIRRCIGFARRWGYGRLTVANLFAFRTTDPGALRQAVDPVGPENDRHLLACATADTILAAWGGGGNLYGRGAAVCDLLQSPLWLCLGRTSTGQPRHPLYIRSDRVPEPYGWSW
jgi:hypothetical protein